MNTPKRDERVHAALASSARQRMLDVIVGANASIDAQSIAARLDLHVTTVRFHLDRLEEAGLVRRVAPRGEPRRGRPRVFYVAVSTPVEDDARRDERSRAAMIGVLASTLAARDADRGRSAALEAGRAWGRAAVEETTGASAANAPGDQRAALFGALAGLGFEPTLRGEEIDLHACPFRGAAAEHPQIVCSVHLGLVREFTGGDASPARLLPFVEPGRCVVLLGAHQEVGTS